MIYEMILVMIGAFIYLCSSFNSPIDAGSFGHHLEKGNKLPMGLTQNIALLDELAASGAEDDHTPA